MSYNGSHIEGMQLTKKLNRTFNSFFGSAFSVVKSVKGYGLTFIKHIYWQLNASKRREINERQGTHVPPFLIHSVTQKCNLRCKGCYSKHLHSQGQQELDMDKTISLFNEAEELGISVIMLAGGEPLTKDGIISAASKYPRIIFPLFTNGLLIDNVMARELKSSGNIFPIISIEGDEKNTDERRGKGTYDSIIKAFKVLRDNSVLFGASITVTRENFNNVTRLDFVNSLKEQGVRIVFYVEYIPCAENTENLVIEDNQRIMLKSRIKDMEKDMKMIFILFPGDEEAFGGCLAAGRGFVHVGSSGKVEPCPFSPYSDSSLAESSLKEALKSRFLKSIRDNHNKLSEHKGGCALWENREWVEKECLGRLKVN